jgi:membrane protease YdiL (CAAX protease family)
MGSDTNLYFVGDMKAMWERTNKFIRSHVIVTTAIISAIFIGLILIFGVTFIGTLDGLPLEPSDLALFTLWQMALSAIVIFLMVKLNVFSRDDFKSKNLGRGLLLGWVAYVGVIINVAVSISSFPADGFIVPSIPHLLITVLHPFIGTGLFEEVLFRGLVLKLLLMAFGNSKKGIIKAVIISSALFGATHISNVIAGAPLFPTIMQIIGAMAAGIFFAALYLRTRNLWVVIILHAISNLAFQIFDAIVSRDVFVEILAAQPEPGVLDSVGQMLFAAIPFSIAGLILLRKVKPAEKVDEIS